MTSTFGCIKSVQARASNYTSVIYPPPPPCPSNPCVQATLGVGSVNFRTVDFGGAFFNWPYCVLCVVSDTWFCVKEADFSMIAFVVYFAPWFSE